MDKHPDEPLTGAKDAAFRHYCSCYPGGKPTYNLKVAKAVASLQTDMLLCTAIDLQPWGAVRHGTQFLCELFLTSCFPAVGIR